MILSKRGSIFLVTLTMLTVVFILGVAFINFTGSEDFSSSMTYESEVAFNLAESAVEEFVARLKNSLNHNDSSNQLYSVLRSANLDVSKDISLDSRQVANLTAYTRDMARQIYGIKFGRGLEDSKDFVVDATLKLKHMAPVEAKSGETVLYKIRQDKKEKQGELNVTCKVNYKGHEAKVSLNFLIRVVKVFVPPFNYFTLFIRDASVVGGSNFNTFTSAFEQNMSLRLDNGWNAIIPNFNAINNAKGGNGWEEQLSLLGEKAAVPPGRIYLGQDLSTLSFFKSFGSDTGIIIRSTNGTKLLYGDSDPNNLAYQMNAQENAFLKPDVSWKNMKEYAKNYMEFQGQQKIGSTHVDFGLFEINLNGWPDDRYIRVFNVGAGREILEPTEIGAPSFINCFQSFSTHTQGQLKKIVDETEKEMMRRFYPDLSLSGFHPWGAAKPLLKSGNYHPLGSVDYTNLSPTLIYGPVRRQYFRAVQFKTKSGEEIELPFVAEEIYNYLADKNLVPGKSKEMNASQAEQLFINSGIPENHRKKLIQNWDELPHDLHEYQKYSNFMSNSGFEIYNKGLANILNRIDKNATTEYEGKLKDFMIYFLESYPYPYDQVPTGMESVISQCPVREFYEGPIAYAMPDAYHSYLLDFYFIPRSTEDFFRGRTTVAIGGVSYDRFEYKYINNVQSYKSGANNQTLELNGILTLNDSEPLGLRNLKFQGHGIIYSSPMMGGGKVAIAGDLLGVDTDENNLSSSIGKNLLTIIAPQIMIDTDHAQGSRCFVEANLISISEPLVVKGSKPITIKGSVVTPYLNIAEHLPKVAHQDNIIIYNALNGIWRNKMPSLMDSMYVAKIVTGGVGKFDWKTER